MPLKPTAEQRQAIKAIKAWFRSADGEFLLDGAPGTGKTTTVGLAIDLLGIDPAHVVFGAYTAKAARQMAAHGMDGATTLHSLLYRPELDEHGRIVGWHRNDYAPPLRSAKLVVVDECSMVSEALADDIRSFKKPILVLGDVLGQLPPIEGLGAFTNREPDFRLTELHRTAEDSPIARLVWRARQGASLPRGGPPEARVAPLDDAAWAEITDADNQVICGKHTTRQAVIRRCRARHGFTGAMPTVGEPLICCRNDYYQGLVNGDIAVLWRITENDPALEWFKADLLVEGEERTGIAISRALFKTAGSETLQVPVPGRRVALFDWAYAITAHKAQGSEFPSVVVIDDQFARWDRDLRRRWLTTALSRASERLQVFTTG